MLLAAAWYAVSCIVFTKTKTKNNAKQTTTNQNKTNKQKVCWEGRGAVGEGEGDRLGKREDFKLVFQKERRKEKN